MYDSHIPCHEHTFLKATSQGPGRVAAGWRHVGDRLIPATTMSTRKFVIRSISISDSGGQCETKQCLSWTRRSLLFWCKDMSVCIIYSRAWNFGSESSSQIREFGPHFFSHRSNLRKKNQPNAYHQTKIFGRQWQPEILRPDLQHKDYDNNLVKDI
jgi:hypothetical protein